MKKHGLSVRETDVIAARKAKYGLKEATDLARQARWVYTGRGRKFEKTDMAQEKNARVVGEKMLGPTGNLRAPVVRVGKTLVVGWCEPAWEEVFGS